MSKIELQQKVKNNDPSVKLKDLVGKSGVFKGFMRVELAEQTPYLQRVKLLKYCSESGTSGLKRHPCMHFVK